MTTFGKAAALLRRHPSFFLPAFFGVLSGRLLMEGKQAANLPAFIALGLLNLAMTAGLLSMIRSAHDGEPALWDAFLIGVGRHFAPILAGSMVMAVLALSTLYPVLVALETWAGIPDSTLLQKALQTGGTLPPAQMDIAVRWATGIAVWAAVWGLALFFLLVWKQAVVVDALPWPKAWRSSIAFVKRHWFKVAVLLAGEALAIALGIVLSTLPATGLDAVGAMVSMIANAFFTVALTVAFIGSRPPQAKAPAVDATA